MHAAIELGGTKVICRAVADDGTAMGERRFATSTPDVAVDDVCGAIESWRAAEALRGIGVASFGPIVVDPASGDFGRFLDTNKPGWSRFDLRAALRGRLGAPLAIDTDVNAAALAELELGAGRGVDSVAYGTVGTGVGGGLASQAGRLHGALHPEIGHLMLRRRAGDDLPSACGFHADCVEGLVSGPALARRLGPGRTLADAPEVAALVAAYLGDLAVLLVLAWAPHRIVLGGGVMSTPGLRERVAQAMREALGNYAAPGAQGADYVAAPRFSDSGLEGALLMARRAAG